MGEIRAIIFDLFGTLVDFDFSRLPLRELKGRKLPVTIEGLDELLEALPCERRTVEDFYDAVSTVSRDIADEISRSHEEVSSVVRFSRALEALGVEHGVETTAGELVRRHMAGLASTVYRPAGRREVVESLRSRYQVGLVSNFDHAPTARHLLEREGLDAMMETVVISDEVGTRKPGTRIFELACAELSVPSEHCVYVGDSYDADVVGASAAGMRSVWLTDDASTGTLQSGSISGFDELPALLAEL